MGDRKHPIFFLRHRTLRLLVGQGLSSYRYVIRSITDLLPGGRGCASSSPFSKLVKCSHDLHSTMRGNHTTILCPRKLRILLANTSNINGAFFTRLVRYFTYGRAVNSPPPLICFGYTRCTRGPRLLSSRLFNRRGKTFAKTDRGGAKLIRRTSKNCLLLSRIRHLPCRKRRGLFSVLSGNRCHPLNSDKPACSVSIHLVYTAARSIGSTLLHAFRQHVRMYVSLPNVHRHSIRRRLRLVMDFFRHRDHGVRHAVDLSGALLR